MATLSVSVQQMRDHLAVGRQEDTHVQRFSELRMRVSFEADLGPDEKQKLIDVAEHGCAVSQTLKRAADTMTIHLVG